MTMAIVQSKAKCPKCKSRDLTLIEVWKGHTISWEQQGGAFDRSNGYLEPGDPYKVEAECCECGYKWRLKAMQIDDVVKNPNH